MSYLRRTNLKGIKMKKIFFSNWKLNILFMVVLVILNIILCCQPTLGTYRGTIKSYEYNYSAKMKFDDSIATINFSRKINGKDTMTGYNIGVYQIVKGEIVAITYSLNTNSSSVSEARKWIIKRNSVFSLTYSGYTDSYTLISATAIIFQCLLGMLYILNVYAIIKLKRKSVCMNDSTKGFSPELINLNCENSRMEQENNVSEKSKHPQKPQIRICSICKGPIFPEEKGCRKCEIQKESD